MNDARVSSVVIVGGDLAGWTAAACLANTLRGLPVEITVLELPDLINVEPVQYTTPAALEFFSHLGIDTVELLRRTGATFRLGTGLHDVIAAGDHRISAYGAHGAMIGFVQFHHYVSREALNGQQIHFNDYSATAVAARSGRFIRPDDGDKRSPPITYGLNLNTEKLTQFLCKNAMVNGVRVTRGNVDGVRMSADGSRIESLVLGDGTSLGGDFYVDCSGEGALLIGAALGVGYRDWSGWLPCSRAIGVTAKASHDDLPLHHCTATNSGWLLHTPLRHRAAYRFVYCPEFVSDDEAAAELRRNLDLDDPEALAMSNALSGHRNSFWHANCVAIGAAAGSVEALEIGSFDLLQSAMLRLSRMWPSRIVQPQLATEYNRATAREFEHLRDFTMLRYLGTGWRPAQLWQRVAGHALPDSLAGRIELFRSRGRFTADEEGVFPRETWIAALLAAEQWPRGYDPLLDSMSWSRLQQHFARMKVVIAQAVQQMPAHRDYLASLTA
jgi:tryptophan halogenase